MQIKSGYLFPLTILLCLLCLGLFTARASAAPATPLPTIPLTYWYTLDTKLGHSQPKLRIDIFQSSSCSHCQRLDSFLADVLIKNPWMMIYYHSINEDKSAIETFAEYLKLQNLDDFSVPAVFFCNTRWAGFKDAETSGEPLIKNISFCRNQIIKNGSLTNQTVEILKQSSKAHGAREDYDMQLPDLLRIPVMATLDALMPETLFTTLILLCFLLLEVQKPLKTESFVLFLLGIGIVHYLQQAYSAYYYALFNQLRFPAALVGLSLLVFLSAYHPRIFSPKRPLPVVMTLVLLLLSGISVQAYQQMHSPNISLIYEQWLLSLNPISIYAQTLYNIFYQVCYSLVIGTIALLLVLICSYYGKWTQRQILVDEFAWQYLMLIGLLLLIYPFVFAHAFYAFISLTLVVVTSWVSFLYWMHSTSTH